jgi:hypothetical protein
MLTPPHQAQQVLALVFAEPAGSDRSGHNTPAFTPTRHDRAFAALPPESRTHPACRPPTRRSILVTALDAAVKGSVQNEFAEADDRAGQAEDGLVDLSSSFGADA